MCLLGSFFFWWVLLGFGIGCLVVVVGVLEFRDICGLVCWLLWFGNFYLVWLFSNFFWWFWVVVGKISCWSVFLVWCCWSLVLFLFCFWLSLVCCFCVYSGLLFLLNCCCWGCRWWWSCSSCVGIIVVGGWFYVRCLCSVVDLFGLLWLGVFFCCCRWLGIGVGLVLVGVLKWWYGFLWGVFFGELLLEFFWY